MPMNAVEKFEWALLRTIKFRLLADNISLSRRHQERHIILMRKARRALFLTNARRKNLARSLNV